MKILFLLALTFSVNAFSSEVSCEYIRKEKDSEGYIEKFELMPSRPDWDNNLRRFSYKVRLEDESFTVEVREGTQKKVATRSVKNIWKGVREPKAPELSFEFPEVKVMVRCK
ncbi:MAG: hypothetical protein ACLGG0_06795 [Bacteriovoracia bacterium]